MTLTIDQSGKIEKTEHITVIAYSNGTKKSILISRKTKRKIQEFFRKKGKNKIYVYEVFAISIFYLIRHLKKQENIIIDIEYPGKDKYIKEILENILKKNKKPKHYINFAKIGNKPPAHYAAKNVFDGKVKPNEVITLEKIIKEIKKDRRTF
jgi:hypothetical protein